MGISDSSSGVRARSLFAQRPGISLSRILPPWRRVDAPPDRSKVVFTNASPLEAAWTVSALFGVAPAIWLLAASILTEGRRRRAGVDGAVKIDMQKSIAVALGLLVISGCFALAGLIAMQVPAPPPSLVDPGAAIGPVLIPMLFVVANMATTLTAGYCLLQNSALDREIQYGVRRDRRVDDPPSHERRPQARG